jgi:general secretion pathway protein M
MSGRDQLALKILAGFALLMIIIFGLIMPVNEFNDKAQTRYIDQLETLNWMQANQSLVKTSVAASKLRDPGQSLLGISNKTAKSYGLAFKRYQPVDDNGLNLWLENVSFNNLILWLERLNKKYGITVKEISVDREDQKGQVNVRLFLQG